MPAVGAAVSQLVYKASEGMEPAACLRTLFGVQSAVNKGSPEKLSQLGREHSHIGRTQRYPELTVKVCFAEIGRPAVSYVYFKVVDRALRREAGEGVYAVHQHLEDYHRQRKVVRHSVEEGGVCVGFKVDVLQLGRYVFGGSHHTGVERSVPACYLI